VIALSILTLPLTVTSTNNLHAEKVGEVEVPRQQAFLKAFSLVSVAEVFDKTWFVTLMLALRHGRQLAMAASCSALAVHVAIAALLGFQISKIVNPAMLDFSAAVLFTIFAGLYFKDSWDAGADSDMIEAGKNNADADECVEAQPVNTGHSSYGGADSASAADSNDKVELLQTKTWSRKLLGAFLTVFVAEWGDRTQLTIIGLHSSLPVVPVFLGSVLAFLILSFSAVMVATVVHQQKINERYVTALVAVSFLVFAGMSFRDGVAASRTTTSYPSNAF
jgi:putative Ca2+/H+ antiporter (TMEM165/GDT1 family)